jgi:TolB-like protein/predicted Zn-dependent protease
VLEPTPAAVFLSYAREDTDAARRLADALRGFGVEVWFDQNELRGGDTWDQKIRGQIRTCALFMPVISARTQERPEGYFRREWKIAVERTHDMADGVPFIVPVVIDGTPESAALVPDQFMRVQWTRLPGGMPTPEFVAQTKRLLEPQRRSPGGIAGTAPAAAAQSSRTPLLAVAAVAALAIGAALFFALRPVAREKAPAAGPTSAAPAAATAPKPSEKSIAVLPFTNMSEEKESAFFADGVHEDILTNLALIRDLKVLSRTTVTQYRDSKKTLRQIGEELGVAYILEGSVRRAGNKVRVTGQLINARNDEHVWAKSYDRDLTDIFAIQAALAQEIAGALEAAISPEARRQLDRRPTASTAAYDLYLQGRDTRNRAPTGSQSALDRAEKLFQDAVALDPGFAAAWGELAVVHALKVFWDRDGSPERRALGETAIARAAALAPEAPDIVRLIGTHAYYANRDYARATTAYEKIIRLQPNDPTGYASLGLILRRQGRWTEALSHLRRAVELDPANVSTLRALISTNAYVRRWDEAIAHQRRLIALLPGQLREEIVLTDFLCWKAGSLAPVADLLGRLTPAQKDLPIAIHWRKFWATFAGDYEEFKRLDQLQPEYPDEEAPVVSAILAATMHFAHGNPTAARARIEPLYPAQVTLTQREPGNLRARLYLSAMELFRGQPDEAVRLTREVVEIMPVSRDAVDGASSRDWLAKIYALAGNRERAIEELLSLARIPTQNPSLLAQFDPSFATLRGHPRFEAMMKDPANNAPLH